MLLPYALDISLFSSLTENIEADQLKQLKSFSSDMNNLADVIKEIQMSNLLTDEEGVEEINDKLKIADHMTKFVECIIVIFFRKKHFCKASAQKQTTGMYFAIFVNMQLP